MTNGWRRAVLLVCCGLLADACDVQSPTAGIDRGGIRTPVVTQGPITGFGSIIVNGVHYDISNAAIDVDGGVAMGADLQLGQLVTVVGERDSNGTTGVATTVSARTNVRGPIQMIDSAAGTLVVLDQDIVVDSGTVLSFGADPSDLTMLSVGDVVSVSGFAGAGGLIAATRIAKVSADGGYRIVGTVSNLRASDFLFNINGLVVNYQGALVIDGFASGGPANGDQVTVSGTTVSANGELLALELRHEQPEFTHDPGGESEVDGLITRFSSAQDFDVGGVPVTTTADTRYEGGDASSLALSVRVEVEGSDDGNGVIVARSIDIKNSGQVVGWGEGGG